MVRPRCRHGEGRLYAGPGAADGQGVRRTGAHDRRPVRPAAPSFQIPYRAGLRTALWILVFGLFCLLPAAGAAGKSFVFPRADIQATVGRGGSLTTSETRTSKVDGSFSWATRRVPLG